MGDGATRPLEDLATPIVAWRGWTIRWVGGRLELASVMATPQGRVGMPLVGQGGRIIGGVEDYRRYRWPPGGVEAECYCATMNDNAPESVRRSLRHEVVPGPPITWTGDGFGCGVYAMKTREQLRSSVWGQFADVLGEVELGGRVWEHELGYRAQHARVRRLVEVTPHLRLSGTTWKRGGLTLLRELSYRYGLESGT